MKSNTTRRRHTNSKLGCLNCKKKKIRCDEHVPECKNCQKSRKNVCSYLSLSEKELNKVKLAHSLRNSTNKLLNSDYRLPTSNVQSQIFLDALEFKHELANLPIRIPNFNYPPLQYKPVSLNELDESMDSRATLEDVSSSNSPIQPTESPSKPNNEMNNNVSKALPGAIRRAEDFMVLDHQIVSNPNVRINEYQFTKRANLDHLLAFVQKEEKHLYIIDELMILLGAAILMISTKNSKLRSYCLESHRHCTHMLQKYLEKFESENDSSMAPILYYSYSFLGYCNLLLGFGLESCVKVSSTAVKIMERYLKINKHKMKADTCKVILNTLQYEMLFINIPSYNPSYLTEVMTNLKDLSPIFDSLPKGLNNIKLMFNQLYRFVKNEYSPILSHGDNSKVIEYPIEMVYNLLKNWIKLYPLGAFVPLCNNHTQEDLLMSNFTSTVYSYYYLIGASLRATFPYMTYILGISFSTLEVNACKEFFEVSPALNLYGQTINMPNLQDLLQRHNYYALRMYSFFRHRARIFIKHVDWEPSYFLPDLHANRWFKNVNEVPIYSFKYTLVRPEHYPSVTEQDRTPGQKFTRTDETMTLKFYTRNIETLKFFDSQYVLQFDYQSMALLRDYRPMSSQCITNFGDLTTTDLEFFRNDKNHIIMK